MSTGEYLLTSDDARRLLQLGEQTSIELSLDLNLTTTEVRVSADGLVLPGGLTVPRAELEEMARKTRRVFSLKHGSVEPVEIADQHYYKLRPTTGAPTIEIDGIQMHRTTGIDPFDDSRLKIEGTVREGDTVLDTCGGLGYTAIWAVRAGAMRVVSVEICPEVRSLRARNPWSRQLFNPPIELVDADIFDYIQTLPDASFGSIIHDPPRFSLAGELYSSEFYAHLARMLKPGGRLFHYTGAPYSRRARRDFPSEVARRLSSAGLRARYEPAKMGITSRK